MALTENQRLRREDAKLAYAAFIPYYPLTLENLPGEEWRNIEGHDGYQVSNFGRVKSFKYGKQRIRKPSLTGEYLRVNLCIDGEQEPCLVHVLVAQAFIPNPLNKPEVNHDDGHKLNCCVGNLVWATLSENRKHAYDTGLNKMGEEHCKAKLTNEQAREIRENPDNLSTYELATLFGIKQSTVNKIQRGEMRKQTCGTIRGKIVRRIADEIRAQIRAAWATGNYTQRELAEKYGVSQQTISRIVNEV